MLGGFNDGDIILDQDSASVLKDALLILSSKVTTTFITASRAAQPNSVYMYVSMLKILIVHADSVSKSLH